MSRMYFKLPLAIRLRSLSRPRIASVYEGRRLVPPQGAVRRVPVQMVQVRHEVLPPRASIEDEPRRTMKHVASRSPSRAARIGASRRGSMLAFELGHQLPLELLPRGERHAPYRRTGQRRARARDPVELSPWERPPQPRRRPRDTSRNRSRAQLIRSEGDGAITLDHENGVVAPPMPFQRGAAPSGRDRHHAGGVAPHPVAARSGGDVILRHAIFCRTPLARKLPSRLMIIGSKPDARPGRNAK